MGTGVRSLNQKVWDIIHRDGIGPLGELKDHTIHEIHTTAEQDHGVSMLEGDYDTLVVGLPGLDPEVGGNMQAMMIHDSLRRWPDGGHVMTSEIVDIAIPVDGLKLVTTRMNITYLVI